MRGGFFRSLQKDFPPRSGCPASLRSPSGSNPRPFPEAAACTACLAALPRTHCPWQLHRAGPRAQIMQPPGPANQARLGGDSHQIKGPPPPPPTPPASGDSCSTSSTSTQPMFSPRRVRFLTRCRDGQKRDPELGGKGKGVGRGGSVWEDGVQRGGLCLGPLESCHKSLLIRRRGI